MKRIAATVLAVATALSLSTGAATAQNLGTGSSKVDDEIRGDLIDWHLETPTSNSIFKEPASSVRKANEASETIREKSSEDTADSVVESSWGIAKSSVKKDVENDDPLGTNLNSLIAIGGLVTLGVIIYNVALQAGIPLPHVAAE